MNEKKRKKTKEKTLSDSGGEVGVLRGLDDDGSRSIHVVQQRRIKHLAHIF